MVPPPDTPGDEFPDFENMSLEEQMAWLESLAKRQGASEDEFLTDADLDIPIPENAVIDEPGYVPYSIRETPAEQAAVPGDETEELEELAEEIEEEFEEEIEPEWEVVSDEIDAVPEGASDPMQWLDTLSVQTGEERSEAIDELAEPAEVGESVATGDQLEAQPLAEYGLPGERGEEQPEFEPEVVDEGETALGWDEEIQAEGEVEPAMSWADLEPSEEFELGAILGEQEPFEGELESIFPEDVDAESWLADLAEQPDAELGESIPFGDEEPESDEAPIVEGAIAPEGEASEDLWAVEPDSELEPLPEDAVQAGLAGQPDVEDDMAILAGADPMAWLETLAKRQGAKIEELTTAADLEIPELPEDTVVDEPGYVQYSPFELLPRDESEEVERGAGLGEEAQPEREEIEALSDLGMIDESLAWLSEVVTEPDIDLAAVLAVEGMAGEFPPGEALAAETLEADPLGDMTDEEIAFAQAHGQLSGEQELAWLKRQADKLAEVRQVEEATAAAAIEDLEPAEPAELPPWLAEMRSETLLDEEALDAETSFPDVAELEQLLDEGVLEDIDIESVSVPESELEAFLSGEFVPEEVDQLAEALDEEYDRRIAQDDSEPEWYAQAVAQVAAETVGQTEAPAIEGDEDFVEAVPVEIPDWLKMTAEESEQAAIEEIPSWLTEPLQAEAEVGEVPEWLAEMSEEPAKETFEWAPPAPAPDLPELAEWMAHETAPAEPSPDVMARAAESIPQTELFNTYRRRLEEDPYDFVNRLGLARALRANQELVPSMDQYEALIDNDQLLEDVSHDLAGLVEAHPETPRVRRLLGDAYMHQGKLQDALDAYRSALDLL